MLWCINKDNGGNDPADILIVAWHDERSFKSNQIAFPLAQALHASLYLYLSFCLAALAGIGVSNAASFSSTLSNNFVAQTSAHLLYAPLLV